MSAEPAPRRWHPTPARALGMVPPLVAGVWVGATAIGGSLDPWQPWMVDLDVYRRTGALVLAGQDFYAAEGLPWIYPPFAALLAVPVAAVPLLAAQVGWIVLNVVLLLAILHRVGLTGWRLSLSTTAAVCLAEPVRDTLGFGQLGVLLVAAAVLDSMPGPRLFRRRLLPEGVLVGLATAVKLTPAAIAATNFFAGRRRPGLVAFGAFVGASVLAAVVLPSASAHYWGGLVQGRTGINDSIIYKTNQSVMAAWGRLSGGDVGRLPLLLAVAVLLLGIVAAVWAHRAGEQQLSICLAGFASLLASPVSWSHHFVWVVPLVAVLLLRTALPGLVRVVGLFYGIWVCYAPFKGLPGANKAELAHTLGQQVVANAGTLIGICFLVVCAWSFRPAVRAD